MTIRDWLQRLEDRELAEKIFQNMKAQGTLPRLEHHSASFANALDVAFFWNKSPEGESFWVKVSDTSKTLAFNLSSFAEPSSAPAATFYNTVGVSGEELREAKERAANQEAEVKKFFIKNPDGIFAPSEVQAKVGFLITSVRRTINTLWAKQGFLERLDRKKNKQTNASEFTYKLRSDG